MFKSNEILVTILMAVYNGEHELREVIENLLKHTHKNFQLIIVNDGSTDQTESIILSFDDHRIEYHKRDKRKGYPCLNDMVKFIKGDFVTFAADDQYPVPDRLKIMLEVANEDPDIDAVFDKCAGLDSNGNVIDVPIKEISFNSPARNQREVFPFMFAGLALSGNPLIRTKSIQA